MAHCLADRLALFSTVLLRILSQPATFSVPLLPCQSGGNRALSVILGRTGRLFWARQLKAAQLSVGPRITMDGDVDGGQDGFKNKSWGRKMIG